MGDARQAEREAGEDAGARCRGRRAVASAGRGGPRRRARAIRPTTAGRPRIRTNEARKDSASRTNAGQNTPARPMIRPARPAPTMPATTRVAWATEFAARRPSRGTTFGMTAPRAGAKNVPTLDWTNARMNSSQSLSALPTRTKPRTVDRPEQVRREHDPASVGAVDVGAGEQPDRQRRDREADRHRGDRRGRAGEVELTSRSRARFVRPSPASETSWPSHSRR